MDSQSPHPSTPMPVAAGDWTSSMTAPAADFEATTQTASSSSGSGLTPESTSTPIADQPSGSPPSRPTIDPLLADTPAPSAPASPRELPPALSGPPAPRNPRRSEPSLPPPVIVRKTSNVSRHVVKKDFPRKSLQATPVTIGPRPAEVEKILPRDSQDPQPKRGLLNRHAKRHRRALTARRFSQVGNTADYSRSSLSSSSQGDFHEVEPGSSAQLISPKVLAMSAGMERSRRASSQSVDMTASGGFQPSLTSIPADGEQPPMGVDDDESEDDDEFHGSSVRSSIASGTVSDRKSRSGSISMEKDVTSGIEYEIDSYPEDDNLADIQADLDFCFAGTQFHRLPHSRWGKVKTKVIKLHNLMHDLSAMSSGFESIDGEQALKKNLIPTPEERSPVNSSGFDKYSLRWTGSKKDASKTMLWLDSDIKLVIGQKAGRWSQKQYRTQFAAQSGYSFSILHPSQKSLDVVCETEKGFHKWIRCIRWICKGEEKREINIKRYMKKKFNAIAAIEQEVKMLMIN